MRYQEVEGILASRLIQVCQADVSVKCREQEGTCSVGVCGVTDWLLGKPGEMGLAFRVCAPPSHCSLPEALLTAAVLSSSTVCSQFLAILLSEVQQK